MNFCKQLKSISPISRISSLKSDSIINSGTIVRFMGRRDKIYGSEESHAEKNEVRKEKWWRKRNPPIRGGNWRKDNGYDEQNALSRGAFALIPEWSNHETGDSGAPSPLQEQIRDDRLLLINQVYEAAMLVKTAQEFEQSKQNTSETMDSSTSEK